MKRTFDIFCSFILINLLFPIIVFFIIIISITSKGGPFYFSTRIGKLKKPFILIKFRSMRIDSDKKGNMICVANDDQRLTRIGKFIRITKIDEIPQLFNVFIGQMSLVGPRPDIPYFVDRLDKKYDPIFNVRPGMTDWSSIAHFHQHDEFSKVDDPDKYMLEVVEPRKLYLQMAYVLEHKKTDDIVILFWTFLIFLFNVKKFPKKLQNKIKEYEQQKESASK